MAKNSYPISFTVPSEIKNWLDAVTETGYYDSLSEFLRDAIRSLLKSEKGLRTAMVSHLYAGGRISLGKAAELLETNLKEAEERLKSMGIQAKR